MSNFDDITRKAGIAFLEAKINTLKELKEEIKKEGYITPAQINGAISSHIDSLYKLLDKSKGEQYQADASADHVTEQIPNV